MKGRICMPSRAEEHCMRRIQQGVLRFHADGVHVETNDRGKWRTLTPRQHERSGRWRYSFLGGYPVYANRLHWMLRHEQPIPDTHFVDHVDENRLNDHPDNLRLMPKTESHSQGQWATVDATLDALRRWFQFVGEHLREPATEHELLWVETGF